MRFVCGPRQAIPSVSTDALRVVLFDRATAGEACAGAAARAAIRRQRLVVSVRAWDALSIALAVVTADLAVSRSRSADGWTREFELDIAVSDPSFWQTQSYALEVALSFLTTDRWHLRFSQGGDLPPSPPASPFLPEEDSAALLSGGLDSLIGTIDLVASGRRPFAVSQVVRGDGQRQVDFARAIGGGLGHLQVNHNASPPGAKEGSQRARSIIFLAFGVVAATALKRYHEGETVPLYISENGFIAVNPPLTGTRIGSLSTRTAHPLFLRRLQQVLDAAAIRVRIENPYQFKTKGEMMEGCADQVLLRTKADGSTSCGRFQRFKYTHCGRCVPCQIRRAAYLRWGQKDRTKYVFAELGRNDSDYAAFDDVRSAAMAIAETKAGRLDDWLGVSLSSMSSADLTPLKAMLRRGLEELAALHALLGVE